MDKGKRVSHFNADSKELKESYVKKVVELYQYEEELYLQESGMVNQNQTRGLPGGIVYFADYPASNTLTLELPDIPPFIKKYDKLDSSDRITIRNHWEGRILRAVENFKQSNPNKEIQPQKSIVVIEARKNMAAPWDPDNLIVKHILDGLKYAGVILDDNYRNVNVSLIGTHVKDIDNQMTKIYVIDISKYDNFLDIYNFKNNIRTERTSFPEIN